MPEQLSTDLSRVGVSAIARSVVEFRSKVGPREYDRGESWRSEALKHLDDVQPVLMQAPPQEARDRLAADAPKLDALVNSFRQNQTTFAAFANQMRDDPSSGGMLRETEANILLRSQLYLAAYFRLLGDQKYAAITKFTLIWPFC